MKYISQNGIIELHTKDLVARIISIIGLMYEYGNGVEMDIDKALQYYNKVNDEYNKLSKIKKDFWDGYPYIVPDIERIANKKNEELFYNIMRYFKQIADNTNDTRAYFALGILYHYSYNTERYKEGWHNSYGIYTKII